MQKNNNTFMIVLLAVTVVIVGVLVWLGYSKNAAITEELMVQRESVTNKIKNLSRKPYVNQSINQANKNRVETLNENFEQVRKMNYDFNSRNFSVPMLEVIGSTPRPALPYDAKVWGDKELAATYVADYRKTMSSLLGKLNPTSVPTEADINLTAKQQMEVLENRARIEGKDTGAAVPGGAPAMPGAAYPGGVPGGSAEVSKDISSLAMENAFNDQVLTKSKSGFIYADDSSLFPMFIRGKIYSKADLPPEDVWLAQKSVWIQTDVINAIRETIDSVFDARKLPKSERNVLNSPIKHLVAINIEKSKGSDSSTNRGGMMGGPGMPGGAGYGGGYQGGGYGSSEVVKADTLTQYSSNELFDVSDYSFTVIMPTRYLPILEQKLLNQNYHVILNEEIVPADSSTPLSTSAAGGIGGFGGGFGGGAASTIKGDLYNYGTEPVSRVTITAQLMLMSNFTRGQWDTAKKEWVRYPLMPAEVMKALPQAALRQEDKDFLDLLGRMEKGEQIMEGSTPTIPWYNNGAWRPGSPAAADVKSADKIQ